MALKVLYQYFTIAALVMPAIIMITIRRWVTPINYKFFEDIYRFVGYSLFNFVVFGMILKFAHWSFYNDVLNLVNIKSKPFPFLLFVFILPIGLGILLSKIDQKNLMAKLLKPIFKKEIETNALTSWEEFFADNPKGNINVVLKDGTQILGYFKKPSRVSSSIEHKDIWVNEVTKIDNHTFTKPMSMWINGNNISHIILDKEKPTSTNFILNLILRAIGVVDKGVQKANEKLDKILQSNKTKGAENESKQN